VEIVWTSAGDRYLYGYLSFRQLVPIESTVMGSVIANVAYPRHIDADPDPNYHLNADPDADPDPTHHFDADPDPDFI
jgi:hypothetical protein